LNVEDKHAFGVRLIIVVLVIAVLAEIFHFSSYQLAMVLIASIIGGITLLHLKDERGW
jgi:hypothetical protein